MMLNAHLVWLRFFKRYITAKNNLYRKYVNEFMQNNVGVNRRRRHLIGQNVDDAHYRSIDRVEATCDRPRRAAVLVRRRPSGWKDDNVARRLLAREVARRDRETAVAAANGV